MSEILFLAHRIPYPPNKGDKIRSWHLLKGLAERFTVHLGTFVDDPDDWQYVPAVSEVCEEVCIRPLNPRIARLRSTRGLLQGRPLTLPYYQDAKLEGWVRDLAARRDLSGVFVFSSSMVQYAEDIELGELGRRVVDLCDVDSDKWRQYAASHSWPASTIYGREARLLEALERRCIDVFDRTLVVAEVEAEILREFKLADSRRIEVLTNGVDTEFFDPRQEWRSPFQPGQRPIVFTGAMDYHANVDAVTWFAQQVFPRIRTAVPEAVFAIVGSNPKPAVMALAAREAILVTGRVPDVRPYLAHAQTVVAPLQIARGVQNKVLEAMAMAKFVVATSSAVQGLGRIARGTVAVADSASDFAEAVVHALSIGPYDVPVAREFVEKNFSWNTQVALLVEMMRPCAPASAQIVHSSPRLELPGQ